MSDEEIVPRVVGGEGVLPSSLASANSTATATPDVRK